MTLQPPEGYDGGRSAATPGNSAPADAPQTPPVPPAPAGGPDTAPDVRQLGNPEGAWLRVIGREPNPLTASDAAPDPVHGVGSAPLPTGDEPGLGASTSADVTTSGSNATPHVVPAKRRPSRPPSGISVVGGSTVHLHRVIALDRLASGVGYLTVEWNMRRHGLDLLALQDGSSVTARGNTLAVDLMGGTSRVLVATGTQGTMTLPASVVTVSNGATRIVVPIEGGVSLGVWPRLTLTRVDEFIVIRHEHDPLSGVLSAVAGAYGYDERRFVLAHT